MKICGEYTCKKLRQDQKLLRNDFTTLGKLEMPLIKRCDVDLSFIELIASDHICINAKPKDIFKSVHFFVEDIKLEKYYNFPEKYLKRLAQYLHVLTPDYSLYADMPVAIQINNTFKNRWCGAYWQSYGLSVIPTVSWSTPNSFEFCFDGIESESIVAISTIGGLTRKELFLDGYFEMKKRINPRQVLCLGKPFSEMGDEVIYVPYRTNKGE